MSGPDCNECAEHFTDCHCKKAKNSPKIGNAVRWISLKEKWPPEKEMVLAYFPIKEIADRGHIGTGFLSKSMYEHRELEGVQNPTHWIPLPPPPTDQASERKAEDRAESP